MTDAALIFLLSLMTAAFVFLPAFNVYKKIESLRLAKKTSEFKKDIVQKIENLLFVSESEFKKKLDEFAKNPMVNNRVYISELDDYLLYALEILDLKNRERLIAVANRMGFQEECIDQIKSRDAGVSALGSRRAGLYQVAEAVDEMISALNILSSENQFEILMGLARFGRADLMRQAFEKIKKNILVNERAVIEILSAFPMGNEKIGLFSSMIHTDTDYINAIFLKAADNEIAGALVGEIVNELHEGSKEVRTAAVRGLSALGPDVPLNEFLAALEDHDWEVRALAAKALAEVRNTESSLALFRALSDQEWWVRQNAASALLTHPDFEPLFILAAESGDEYTKDSIIAVLENGVNPVLLRSIKIMAV